MSQEVGHNIMYIHVVKIGMAELALGCSSSLGIGCRKEDKASKLPAYIPVSIYITL